GVLRRLNDGGPPGADAPTHRTRAGAKAGGNTTESTGMAGPVEKGDSEDGGRRYPEWYIHRRRYRRDWCTVQEIEPRPDGGTPQSFADGYGFCLTPPRRGATRAPLTPTAAR